MQKFFLFIGRYYSKITIPTKKPKLHAWMIGLQRFNKMPLAKSVEDQSHLDFNYFWINNRAACFEEERESFRLLPYWIKTNMMVNYLFRDMIQNMHLLQ